MDRESKLEAARRKLRKFQAKRSKPSDDDAVNTSFHTSDLLSPENLNADGVPYSPTASPDRPDTLTDDQSHVMVEATPIQTSMMGGLVGAQNAHTGIGSPVYLMRHTEKRTIRTKSSNPAMSDIQEKKAQSERIAASVTAGIAQEIMMYERHLQSTSPNSSARSSITSLQITSSQDLSSQQITKAFNDTNTSFHPDAYISDLQDQLARRNAQITMLRKYGRRFCGPVPI
ncbi:hypothetical protein BC829DRAFT_213870 [Chytridium lagenaria]|nr:hypothetical protein BC829DRAFT_213870 [Chytridium lagenaria]